MHEFPYTANNYLNSERVTIESKEDVENLFTAYLEIENPETWWSACKNSFCPNILYDQWVTDMINRYSYSEKYPSVAPYPGSYDDQPAVWLDAQRIIGNTITELQKFQRDNNGG
jgi:hypothetical protein